MVRPTASLPVSRARPAQRASRCGSRAAGWGGGAGTVAPGERSGVTGRSLLRRRRRVHGRRDAAGDSLEAADDLDVEVAELLAQRVAVEAEQLRGLDLVAAGGGEREREQRAL